MPYIVDGHNLIPNVAGLSLEVVDDELQLVEMLQIFCRVRRSRVEVYFDRTPPGYSGVQQFGAVKAHFIREGSTADDAIARRVRSLKQDASNWVVVSSDNRVRSEAVSRHAQILSSGEFASQLQDALWRMDKKSRPVEENMGKPQGTSAAEVEEWLQVFTSKKKKP
jgi:uncharacterized protein